MSYREKPFAATLLLLSLLFISSNPIYSMSAVEKWTQLGIDPLGDAVLVQLALSSNADLDFDQGTNMWLEQDDEADSFTTVLSRAPNTEDYFMSPEALPELPCPTPFIFTSAVLATVYFICKRRSKHHD